MDCRAELLRAFEREPQHAFATSRLVEAVYPKEMRSVREHLEYGSREQKRSSQALKSKLHRKVLYYLGVLLREGVLDIARLDAHGEKIYRLKERTAVVQSKSGPFTLTQPTLKLPYIEDLLERNAAVFYDQPSILSRFNAVYIDCARLDGLGQLVKLLEHTLKVVNDVVCLGHYESILGKYGIDELREFLATLHILTLDEAKGVCITIAMDTCDPTEFIRLLSGQLPRRVYLVFTGTARDLQREPFLRCVDALRERHEKVNVHLRANHASPVFIGRAGVYGFQAQEWEICSKDVSVPVSIVSQATLLLDMQRFAGEPAHAVRAAIQHAAKTMHSIASQQRLVNTGIKELRALHPQAHESFSTASVYLRFWNYDWEASSDIIASMREELQRFTRTQETIYRACGLPFHFHLQLSSAFPKYAKGLSPRTYRKWTIASTKDLSAASFQEYVEERLKYLQIFGGIDRFRIFRSGNPSASEVAREIVLLGERGLPFVTVDFKPLQGVRRLTEYFG